MINFKELFEKIIKKRIRTTKGTKLKVTSDKVGYKIVNDGGRRKEVKMKPDEIRKRSKSAKIAGRKGDAKLKRKKTAAKTRNLNR